MCIGGFTREGEVEDWGVGVWGYEGMGVVLALVLLLVLEQACP